MHLLDTAPIGRLDVVGLCNCARVPGPESILVLPLMAPIAGCCRPPPLARHAPSSRPARSSLFLHRSTLQSPGPSCGASHPGTWPGRPWSRTRHHSRPRYRTTSRPDSGSLACARRTGFALRPPPGHVATPRGEITCYLLIQMTSVRRACLPVLPLVVRHRELEPASQPASRLS